MSGSSGRASQTIEVLPAQPGGAPLGRMLKDSGALASGQTVALAAGAISALLAARWLGAGAKGQLALIFAVPALLGPLAAGGVDSYIAARAGGRDGGHQASMIRLGRRAARWGGAAIALATLAYGLATGLPWGPVFLAAALAGFRPALTVLQAVATNDDQIVRVGRVLVAMAVFQLSVVAVLALDGATVFDFAAASALAVVVGHRLMGASESKRRSRAAAPLTPSDRRQVLHFGGTVVVADALQLANYRIDLFILAAFVPVADIGVYAVAVALAEMLWQLPQAVSRSMLPRIVAGQLDRARVSRISLGLGVVAAGLGVVGWLMTVRLVEPVFGADFAAVPLVLAVLLPGVVLVSAAKPLAAWTISCGLPRRNLKASAVGFLVVILGNVVLVPRFGILGAAAASTLAYGSVAAAVTFMAPRYYPSPCSVLQEDL